MTSELDIAFESPRDTIITSHFPFDITKDVPAMDRRTALKQLAAGGAITAGGSLILSSTAVAATCSALVAPSDPFTLARVYNKPNKQEGELTIGLNSTADLGANTTTYHWRINSYSNLGNNRVLAVRNSDDTPIVSGPSSNACGPSTGCPTSFFATTMPVILSARKANGQFEDLAPGDVYSIQAWISWKFDDCPTIDAYYNLAATWPTIPTTMPE